MENEKSGKINDERLNQKVQFFLFHFQFIMFNVLEIKNWKLLFIIFSIFENDRIDLGFSEAFFPLFSNIWNFFSYLIIVWEFD